MGNYMSKHPLTAFDAKAFHIIINERNNCFDLLEAPNPQKAEAYWSVMVSHGYAEISDFSRVMFERIKGRFVSITQEGKEAMQAFDTESQSTPE